MLRSARTAWLLLLSLILIVMPAVTACTTDKGERVSGRNNKLGASATANLTGENPKFTFGVPTGQINYGLAAPAGKVVDVAVVGGTLKGNAELTLDVPKGYKATELAVYTYDETRKQPILMGGKPSKDGRSLTVTTNHFSKWWLSPIDPRVLPPSINVGAIALKYLSNFTKAAPATDCTYPAQSRTVLVDTNTLPKGVEADVCVKYDKHNHLTIDIGNSSGAPLLVSPGPGMKLTDAKGKSTTFNNLASSLRQRLGDNQVSLGGAQRLVFTVDPKHIKNKGEVHFSAKLDIGYTALAFSGALLDAVAPVFKDKSAAQTAYKAADETAKYSECIDKGSLDVEHKLMSSELTAQELNKEVLLLQQSCNQELFKLLHEATRDNNALNPLYRGLVSEQLLKFIVERLGAVYQLVINTGNLVTQPLYTAYYAGEAKGVYQYRADINEPIGATERNNALPDEAEGPFINDPATHTWPDVVNGQKMDYRPAPGGGCTKLEMRWNPDWLEEHAGRQPSLLADGKVQAIAHLAVVKPDHKAAVARYFTFLREMKECRSTKNEGGYSIAFDLKAFDAKVKWSDKYVVTYRELIGYAGSEGDRVYHAYVYDKKRGYLFGITATVAEGRDVDYTSDLKDAVFEQAISDALTHMHERLGMSLGMY